MPRPALALIGQRLAPRAAIGRAACRSRRGRGGPSGSHSLPLRERVPKLSRSGRVRGLDGRRDPGWGASGPPSAECRSRSDATPCPPFPTTAPPPIIAVSPSATPGPAGCHPAAVPPPSRGLALPSPRHPVPLVTRVPPVAPGQRPGLCPGAGAWGAAGGSWPGAEPSGEGLTQPGGGEPGDPKAVPAAPREAPSCLEAHVACRRGGVPAPAP